MSLRDTTQVALLLAVGTVLRIIMPAYGAGMKPDVALAMLFIIIVLKPKPKVVLISGIIAGILAALTTGFPGGQIPNIIDKPLTAMFALGIVTLLKGRIHDAFIACLLSVVATIFSGTVFMLSALALVGLPAAFSLLFTTVVLPGTILNTISTLVLYPVINYSKNLVENAQKAK
jgi:hypothetical protein